MEIANIIKMLLLFIICFLSVTYIPREKISKKQRFSISMAIVIIYALLDYIKALIIIIIIFLQGIICRYKPPT